MTKKEKMELLFSKVTEEQKAGFAAGLREAKTKEARRELFEKFNISLSEDERAAMQACSNEVSDEELDVAAGGCCSSNCDCHGLCTLD